VVVIKLVFHRICVAIFGKGMIFRKKRGSAKDRTIGNTTAATERRANRSIEETRGEKRLEERDGLNKK